LFGCVDGEGDSPEAVAVGSLAVVNEVFADIVDSLLLHPIWILESAGEEWVERRLSAAVSRYLSMDIFLARSPKKI